MLWISIELTLPKRLAEAGLFYYAKKCGNNMALTIKQKQVVDDFIITGNRTKSYLKFYKNIKIERRQLQYQVVFL